MTCEMINPLYLRKRMNQGAHTRLQVTTVFLNLPKPNTIGNQKQELRVKYVHQISQIFTSANVNHKYRTFKANY